MESSSVANVPPPQAPKSHALRNTLLVVAVVLVVLTILGAAFFAILYSTGPAAGIGLAVIGSRTNGYTASFYLIDSSGNIVTSKGNVTFRILDGGFNVLYRTAFQVSPSEFNVQNHTLGFLGSRPSSGLGYQWKISASQVAPALVVSSGANPGRAEIFFLTPMGENLTLLISGSFSL